MPLHEPFLGYYEHIIKPAANEAGLEALRADEIFGTGPIIKDIWDSIWKARVVVADVTDKNPNVNYELGLCHALGVPTILITKRIDDVPFDYRHRRCIVYDTQSAGWESRLRVSLKKTVLSVLASPTKEELSWPYDTNLLKDPGALSKVIVAEDPARIVIRGCSFVHGPVSKAYGPQGTLFSVTGPSGARASLKGGGAIARAISSHNPLEDRGIQQLATLAAQLTDRVGDGAKLGVILAYHIMKRGREALEAGHLATELVRGMDRAIQEAVAYLSSTAKAGGEGQLVNAAITAAGGDNPVGTTVCEALKKVGKDGIVSIQRSLGTETWLELKEGIQFDRGYLSPYFVTEPETMECVIEDVLILITEKKVSSMKELLPVLEQVAQSGKPLLLIAEDVEGEALSTLVVNKIRGALRCCAVKAPGIGDRRKAVLDDIAILTGAMLFTQDFGQRLEDTRLEELGYAKRIVVTKGTTTIVEGAGKPKAIESRIKQLRREIDETFSDHGREVLQERLANLVGGVAIIHAGGLTEFEVLNEEHKIRSALSAASSAVEEGWVPGGGLALYHARESVEKLVSRNESETVGINVVMEALEQPLGILIENSKRSPTQIISEIAKRDSPVIGFDASDGGITDVVAAGVLDPVKVIRAALQLAMSSAGEILRTGTWELKNLPSSSGRNPANDW